MKRLHLFLIKIFTTQLIVTFFIAIFILLMQFLWKYIDDLVGKGLEFTQIAELLFYASARFVPVALPIAILLSSVMVFGKLAEQDELSALKASGISLYKILQPLILLVFILSYGSFLFSNYVMPIANLKNGAMIYDIQKQKPALNIKEGVFYTDIEGFSIKVEKKENNGLILKNILIYEHLSQDGNNNVIIADKGKMEITKDERFLEFILYNGHSYIDIPENNTKIEKNAFRTTHFKKNLIRFNLESFNTKRNSEKLYKGHYAMLNNKQLKYAIDSLQEKYQNKEIKFQNNIIEKYHNNVILQSNSIKNKFNIEKKQLYNIAINKTKTLRSITKSKKQDLKYQKIIITKHKIEWHRKISLAIACIILFLIGSSLGSIIKKGGFGMPLLVSIILFILYHILSIIGEKSAKELNIQAYEGMWLANTVFLPLAFLLIYIVKNDIEIFNFSKLYMTFNKLKKQ